MGEKVQVCLEELIPVFEQCQRVELFSPHEIKTVIKTCNKYEYKMNKVVKSSTKEAVAYAEYLEKFLKLIIKRRAKLDYQFKKTEIDFAITRKVETIYRIACERFKADLPTWLARIKFARSRNMKATASKVYVRMLQLHSGKPNIWLQAAKWELEENHSMENARSLLQKALRFHSKTNNKLWTQLFKLELLYVQKLTERRDALMQSSQFVAEKVELEAQANDLVMKMQLAKIVAQQSIEARPSDVHMYLQLLSIANEFPFANALSTWLYESLCLQFPRSEEVWMMRVDKEVTQARQKMKSDKAGNEQVASILTLREGELIEIDQAAFAVLDEALLNVSSSKMYRLSLEYCQNLLQMQSDLISPKVFKLRREKLEDIYGRMQGNSYLQELDYVNWAQINENQAEQIIQNGLKKFSGSCILWLKLVEYSTFDSKKDQKSIFKIFNKAVKKVAEKDSLPLWTYAIQWAAISCPQQVPVLFKGASVCSTEVSKGIREMELEWMASSCLSNDQLIESLSKLTQTTPNSLDFYSSCVSLFKSSCSPCIKSIENVFERAILEHGTTSPQVWMDYAKFEMTFPEAHPGKASNIYERAIKRLDGPAADEFIRMWTTVNVTKCA